MYLVQAAVSTEFSAEVRHGLYSPSETVEGAFSWRRPWLPAKVSFANGMVRIQTSGGIEEFRLRRISWKGPSTFLVSGLTKNSHLRSRVLRFKSSEEARQAASSLKEQTTLSSREVQHRIIETPVPSLEEVPVRDVLLRRTSQLFFVVGRALLFLFFLFLFYAALRARVDFLIVTIFGILLAYAILTAMLEFKALTVKTEGWLRLEGSSLSLRTPEDWIYVNPNTVNWASPDRIEVHTTGTRIELGFSTADQASAAMRMIKASYRPPAQP